MWAWVEFADGGFWSGGGGCLRFAPHQLQILSNQYIVTMTYTKELRYQYRYQLFAYTEPASRVP